ncbi:MAG: V-type ATP synthase subunit F [Gammaproteobacteria bacterium]|nr:V-type ATP synthase subunit F [Gammaproteobacteria bacterium]
MKIVAMGSSALMDGFALLGIQTYADLSLEKINDVLLDVKRKHRRALVFLEQDIINADIPMVNRWRNQGGSMLICEIPALDQLNEFQPEVEQLIARVMGTSVLENKHG